MEKYQGNYEKWNELDSSSLYMVNKNADRNMANIQRMANMKEKRHKVKKVVYEAIAAVTMVSAFTGMFAFGGAYTQAKIDLLYKEASQEYSSIVGVEPSQYSRGGFDMVYFDGRRDPLPDDIKMPTFGEIIGEMGENNIIQPMYENYGSRGGRK